MGSAFLWGFVAASSLIVGGLVGSFMRVGERTLGLITGFPALGFFGGAFTFFFADLIISRIGGRRDDQHNPAAKDSLVVPLVLGIVLDGIPESVVIGLGVLETGNVSVAMLIAVFVSNVPEAIAGTVGMRGGGWSTAKTLALWSGIALVCAVASAAGYALLGSASVHVLAFVQAFAGGAMMMMLANTMIPEAYERAGKLAGVATVMGFALAVSIVIFEHSAA
jgi:ZIP family zinc transporter